MKRLVRIGTRTSLMAMAQAKKVAALLQGHHAGIEVELVGINSTGDKDKTTPLWQMNVVGIFSRELDTQLLEGEVDCVVHSFKDLGTERPQGLAMAALLPRDNPRDIVLFRPDVMEKLRRGAPVCIGTSSPRRMLQVPQFLAQALPKFADKVSPIHTETLRGNANSRIEKLKNQAPGAPHYDGIVLALAGLTRLMQDDAACPVTRELLGGLKPMVLPLTHCPTAPGQGVVCVETRADDTELQALLAPLHCAQTSAQVMAERNLLLRHGGGCHQRFGATQLHLPQLPEPVMMVRGENKDGIGVDEDIWGAPILTMPTGRIWSGQAQQGGLFTHTRLDAPVVSSKALFITHTRALPEGVHPEGRIWVSGTDTWFKLAARGLWVEGCGENFGIEFLKDTLQEPALGLPPLGQWQVLTHAAALNHWQEGQATATYKLEAVSDLPRIQKALAQATVAWWGSGTQFEYLGQHSAHIQVHACGAGRTALALRAKGITPLVFPSYAVFSQWAVRQGWSFIDENE